MSIFKKITERTLVKGVTELKNFTTEEEFLNSPHSKDFGIDDWKKIKNSKWGSIKIKKESDNLGYLKSNEAREGYTPIFAEGFSCFIFINDDPLEDYYYTSNIVNIDWDKGLFNTLNSTYSFILDEMTPEEYENL